MSRSDTALSTEAPCLRRDVLIRHGYSVFKPAQRKKKRKAANGRAQRSDPPHDDAPHRAGDVLKKREKQTAEREVAQNTNATRYEK